MTESKRLKAGFSIVEIMIVILIIGVLTAGVFGGFRLLQRVKLSNTNNKLAAVDTALEQYFTQIGEYPTELRELVEGPSKQGLQKRWGEALAAQDELVDAWQQPFVYQAKPKGSRPPYELYSIGSKGNAQIFSPRSQG